MVPYAAAGPLSGTVAPIRMLLAVTPTSLALPPPPPPPLAAGAGALVAAAGALLPAGALGAGLLAVHATSTALITAIHAMRTMGCLTLVHPFSAPVCRHSSLT